MIEDFRCSACGHSTEYEFGKGNEKALHCPRCNQLWKVEKRPGRFRLLMWI